MPSDVARLLELATFPDAGTAVDLAVSGGPDSMGLLLLALDAGLVVTVHHVNHHARVASDDDARYVLEACTALSVPVRIHDVTVKPGSNFESRARSARHEILPTGVLTGHTMDDLAETVVLNMLRGAGLDGLSPMIGSPTKPLLALRRAELHRYVHERGVIARHDETNDDLRFRRNEVRHRLVGQLNDVAQRDVVPILARQALAISDDRRWLDELAGADRATELGGVDCRVLRDWPVARLRRWLRWHLRDANDEGQVHPPTFDELDRVLAVVRGEVTACELSGGRRLSRSGQRLTLT